MASNVESKQGAQDSKTHPVAEHREGGIATVHDPKATPSETASSQSQHATDRDNAKNGKGGKSTNGTGTSAKKRDKASSKSKKWKLVHVSSTSEDDEEDPTDSSLSTESSDSDLAYNTRTKKKTRKNKAIKKPRASEKRHPNSGKSKRRSKAKTPSSSSEDDASADDSGEENMHGSGSDDGQQDMIDYRQQLLPYKRRIEHLQHQVQNLQLANKTLTGVVSMTSVSPAEYNYPDVLPPNRAPPKLPPPLAASRNAPKRGHGPGKSSSLKKAQRLEYKRVDQVWDPKIHNYKLKDTTKGDSDARYDEYLFHVRRTFDWRGKYKSTVIDIKSKQLREALQQVIGTIKGISLVEETPELDPNMLFLYLEDLREHMHNLKHLKPDGKTRRTRKERRRVDEKRYHLKVLIQYLDKDFAQVKKSLYPLLENGLITFEFLWALWKPNTLVYTTTYGSTDEPRVFKIELAQKQENLLKGEFYVLEGKYLEYDGKQFGYGYLAEEISNFQGARKITSLDCYPLKYNKDESEMRGDLIQRGKKFVSLGGVHYKSHQGMAYFKKKKNVIKVNTNGRIMVDPSTHRRINPNYPVSLVRPKDHDILSDGENSDDDKGGCDSDSESDGGDGDDGEDEERVKYVIKVVRDAKGIIRHIPVPKLDFGPKIPRKELDTVDSKPEKEKGEVTSSSGGSSQTGEEAKKSSPQFTDEDYLIASPVVLGFAFVEKMWLEFTVSGIKDITWNERAYDSLVLESEAKDIVKALVESHKYHAAESIDDVIQGKGKGLVAVLHGPPGTGKTLTAEGISELLKCPLYMVSAGDLGTDSRHLEGELQKILDICHAWGAILLLDEADVFLEKRNMQDIHRNALVSVFLRQLEYFQGILFLTTNRVETFDNAFQSRIHIALRYDELDINARKAIFKIFIERVRVLEKMELMPFTEADYSELARHHLNGRQIKNTVGTAQALAVNKGEPLSMRHIHKVLDVHSNFDRDLKGGPGYQDAMRSYF